MWGRVDIKYRKLKQNFRKKRKICVNYKSTDGKPFSENEETAKCGEKV